MAALIAGAIVRVQYRARALSTVRGARAWSVEVRRDPCTGNAIVTLDGIAIYAGEDGSALKVAERETSRASRGAARALRWRRKRRQGAGA